MARICTNQTDDALRCPLPTRFRRKKIHSLDVGAQRAVAFPARHIGVRLVLSLKPRREVIDLL
jgi:hypothetical protein